MLSAHRINKTSEKLKWNRVKNIIFSSEYHHHAPHSTHTSGREKKGEEIK